MINKIEDKFNSDFNSIKKEFNLLLVKRICVLIISLYILISFIRHKELDCSSQLLKGKLIDDYYESDLLKKSEDCVLMKYNIRHYETCLSNTEKLTHNISFVGSEIIEEFYIYFKRKFRVPSVYINNASGSDSAGYKVSSDDREDILEPQVQYKHFDYIDESFVNFIKNWPKEKLPDLIVMGFDPFNHGSNNFNTYLTNVSDISFQLDVLGESTVLFWIVPYFKASENRSEIYKKYEDSIHNSLKGNHVKLWKVFRDEELSTNPNKKLSQVILNFLCNNNLEPNSTSLCCSGAQNRSLFERRLQIYVIIGLFTTGLFLFYAYVKRSTICHLKNRVFNTTLNKKSVEDISGGEDLLKSHTNNSVLIEKEHDEKKSEATFYLNLALKSICIFSYFYVCDRTNLFVKKYKEFHASSFYIPLFGITLASFVCRQKCSSTKPLNREITEEWKGWMQVVILIYHMTGASSQIPIYMHIRILVSSYLFMTGFGNFCYYWQGGELTFRRYCQVMLRMNLLTIMLCLIMKEYYQFYYFVPLVSFWYTFLFLVLLIPPHLSSSANSEGKAAPTKADYFVTLVKFAISALAITVLSFSKKIFDEVFLFRLWRFLFVLPGHEDQEWWFRWNLDKYSVLYGALFGLVYKGSAVSVAKHFESRGVKEQNSILAIMLTSGLVCMSSYFILTSQCFSKQECNQIHPYIVWIPIVGYVAVRNVTELARGYCSTLMVNAGKISLELFICQYHIWLAGNTKGSLVLLPWAHPLFNYLIVTAIFVWIAHEVHFMTGEFVNLITPKDNKKILINLMALMLFFLVLNLIL